MKRKLIYSTLLAATLSFVGVPAITTDCNVTYAAEVDEKATFDPVFYAAAYPDVATVIGIDVEALWQHYINFGKAEGRYPNAVVATTTPGVSVTQTTPATVEDNKFAYDPTQFALIGEPVLIQDKYGSPNPALTKNADGSWNLVMFETQSVELPVNNPWAGTLPDDPNVGTCPAGPLVSEYEKQMELPRELRIWNACGPDLEGYTAFNSIEFDAVNPGTAVVHMCATWKGVSDPDRIDEPVSNLVPVYLTVLPAQPGAQVPRKLKLDMDYQHKYGDQIVDGAW